MELKTRHATASDLDAVSRLYDKVHAAATRGVNYNWPTWVPGQYPSYDTAKYALQEGTLHVGLLGGTLCAAVILNQTQYDGYERAPWRMDATPDKVMVINALVVDPAYRDMRIGQQMIDYAKEMCRETGCITIRLSTYRVNLPAIRLYEKCGFTYLCNLDAQAGAETHSFAMLDWLPAEAAR